MKKFLLSRTFWLTILGLLVLISIIFAYANFPATPVKNDTSTTNIPIPAKSDLLQFTSQGNVIGFQNDGVIVASATHMLKISFLNSNAVTPVADSPKESTPASTTPSVKTPSGQDLGGQEKASPLSKVTYRNIWNGIDLTYEANKDSLMKSTYYINLTEKNYKISPDSIRLKYNRPVSIDTKGNLIISYDLGNVTESVPLAWQEIGGKRVPVAVSFSIKNKNEVGFILGSYTSNIPIVIDPTYTYESSF